MRNVGRHADVEEAGETRHVGTKPKLVARILGSQGLSLVLKPIRALTLLETPHVIVSVPLQALLHRLPQSLVVRHLHDRVGKDEPETLLVA